MNIPRSPRSPRSPSSSHFAMAQQHLPARARRPSVSPRSTSSPTLPTFKNLHLRSPGAPQRSSSNPQHTALPTSPLSRTGPRPSGHSTPPARPPLLMRRTTTAGLLLPSSRSATLRPGSPGEQAGTPPISRSGPGSRRASLTLSVCSSVSSAAGSTGRAPPGPVPPSLLRGGARWPSSSSSVESEGGDGVGPKVKGWRADVANHQLQGYPQLGLPSPAQSFSSRISPPRPSPSRSASMLSRNGSAGSSLSSGSRLSVRVASPGGRAVPPEAAVYGFHLLPSPGAPTEQVWNVGEAI